MPLESIYLLISLGFMGATVTVDMPQGTEQVAAKVVVDPVFTKPVLLVPQGSALSEAAQSATVQKTSGEKIEVALIEAPVQEPTLAVPQP